MHAAHAMRPASALPCAWPAGPRTNAQGDLRWREAPRPVMCSAKPPKWRKYIANRPSREVEREYTDMWLDVTSVGAKPAEPTLGTKIGYVFLFAKYQVVPEVVRYVWYVIWRAIVNCVVGWRRGAIVASKLAKRRGGSALPMLFGHAGVVAQRSVGVRRKATISSRGMGVILRESAKAWEDESAFWHRLWMSFTRPARNFFKKRATPLEGYEESWLRRYEEEMTPQEIADIKSRIEGRTIETFS